MIFPMKRFTAHKHNAFTLVEVLVVLAVIGVMTSMVINVYKNVTKDSNEVVARQQQVAVQNAVNNWVSAKTSRPFPTNSADPTSAKVLWSLSKVRTEYNNQSSGLARLNLVSGYLDSSTYAHLSSPTDVNKITSAALNKSQQYLELGTWASGNYPQVKLLP